MLHSRIIVCTCTRETIQNKLDVNSILCWQYCYFLLFTYLFSIHVNNKIIINSKIFVHNCLGTQEEAAEAYDIAAIKLRGLNAVTNFDLSRYDVKSIANSNLPIGGLSTKGRNSADSQCDGKTLDGNSRPDDRDPSSSSSLTFASQPSSSSTLSFAAIPIKQDPSDNYWSNILGFQSPSVKNPNFANGYALPTSNTTPFSMDFGESNSVLSNGGVFLQQQSGSSGSSSSSMLPFATPSTLNSNNGQEGSNSTAFGNWIGSSVHTFQAHSKPSLFQTPIGIE